MPRSKFARYGEIAFDAAYLCTAVVLGCIFLLFAKTPQAYLYGIMTLTLVAGDTCHLVPRVRAALAENPRKFTALLGYGKFAASVGMTLFYVLLWHIGLLIYAVEGAALWTTAVYALAAMRIVLCLLPQNRWREGDAPNKWNILRNIPFTLLGAMVCGLFFTHRGAQPASLSWMWLAVLLSFLFYLPVVLFAHKRPALGMLMLPKSCAYVWIIAMGLSLL